MPSAFEIGAVQMPGRGLRAGEPALTSILSGAPSLASAIQSCRDKPFAFFGHSMGALLSFEVARILCQESNLELLHLFVSGRLAPQIANTTTPTYNLPEPEFLKELQRLNGTPPEVLTHRELMSLIMPSLRADFEACQTYPYTPGPVLTCPLTVLGGLEDEATAEQLDAWRVHTTKLFRRHMLPGDHFFINSQREMVLGILTNQLLEDLQVKAFRVGTVANNNRLNRSNGRI